jgi:hypothetical protein
MQRWQRRAHLWLWLLVGAMVIVTFAKLLDDQPELAPASEDMPAQ